MNDDSESECAVCYAVHDEEIHQATLRIRRWFCGQVTHHFEDGVFVAPDLGAGCTGVEMSPDAARVCVTA